MMYSLASFLLVRFQRNAVFLSTQHELQHFVHFVRNFVPPERTSEQNFVKGTASRGRDKAEQNFTVLLFLTVQQVLARA